METNGKTAPAGTGIDFQALAAPFDADAVEWRLQSAGEKNGRLWARCVPFIGNRAIMDRLDQVAGPANWWNEYRPGPAGGVVCGLSIRVGERVVTKWDGAENSKGLEGGEVKGGLSNAMKRAAVQWGIGRYLYSLPESFAVIGERGRFGGRTKDQKSFRWDPPELPAAALPRRGPGNGHGVMVDYLRAVQDQIDARATVHIQGVTRPLLTYMKREGRQAIESDRTIARAVVDAAEKATGVSFQLFAATGAV